MNCSPTITAEEFKTIHNALWELDCMAQKLESVLKPDLHTELTKISETIRSGLRGAYEQDTNSFDRKSKHFGAVKSELGLRNSEWSIYEVDNLSDSHPFPGATKLLYKDHWGEEPVVCEILGFTWAALWVAADACIRDSGDEHHVFVENFKVSKKDPETLILYTGS